MVTCWGSPRTLTRTPVGRDGLLQFEEIREVPGSGWESQTRRGTSDQLHPNTRETTQGSPRFLKSEKQQHVWGVWRSSEQGREAEKRWNKHDSYHVSTNVWAEIPTVFLLVTLTSNRRDWKNTIEPSIWPCRLTVAAVGRAPPPQSNEKPKQTNRR